MITLLPPFFYETQRRETKCITANDDDSPCTMTSVQIFPIGKNHVVCLLQASCLCILFRSSPLSICSGDPTYLNVHSFRTDTGQAYISHVDEAILQSSPRCLSGSPPKSKRTKIENNQISIVTRIGRLDQCGRLILGSF